MEYLTSPLSSSTKVPQTSSAAWVVSLKWILSGSPLDSILEEVLTVSPKRQ